MIRRLTAVVASGAVALVGFGTVGAAPSSADTAPLYKLPYSDALFVAVVDGEDLDVQDISFAQWEELGFPAYQLLSTQYFKSSFSPEVYAVSDFPGTAFDRYPDALSYAEWASVGFPTPRNGDRVVVQYLQHSTSAELFAVGLESAPVKLSYGQWQATGFPPPEPSGLGFHKLSWDDHIALRTDDGASSEVLSLESWQSLGLPTPQVSPRLQGDRFYFASRDTDVITYQGPSFSGPITLAQWIAAGQPAPEAYEPATAVVIGTTAGVPADLLPEVSGTGEPAADITLTVGDGPDAVVVGTATVDEDGAWSATADLTGRYGEQVTVTATQAFAGKDDELDTVDFDLELGAVIGSPAADAGPLSREELGVSGTGRPGEEVRLSVGASAEDQDRQLLGFATVDVDGTWSTTVDVGGTAAIDSVLVAEFSDVEGPTASDSVAIELDVVAADAVDLLTVDGGTQARSLLPTVSGTGEAGALVTLTLDVDGVDVEVGSTEVDVDGGWTTPVDLEGHYGETVVLAATQAIPASGTTQDTITLDLALGLTITSPVADAALASRSFVMTGTGAPGSTVTLTWGNHPDDEQPDLIGSPVVSTDGTWTADVVVADEAPVGSWLNATAAGEPRAQVSVQLPEVVQTFTITSPANGATGVPRGSVTATGTGVPGSFYHLDLEKADDPFDNPVHLTFGTVPESGVWEFTYDPTWLGFDDQRLINDEAAVSVVYTLEPPV